MRKKIFCRMCRPELMIYAEYHVQFMWDGEERNEHLCNRHTTMRTATLKKNYGVICNVKIQQQPVPMLWS